MGDMIIGGIIMIVLGLAVFKMYRDKKNHKSCCSSCSGCKHAVTDNEGNSGCGH